MTQAASKDDSVSHSNSGTEQLPLLADLVLYYCRHADQPVLVQLYQVEVRADSCAHTHTRRQTHTQACTGHNNHEYFLPLHSSPWLEERGEGKYLFSLWSLDTRLEPELWRPWVSHTLKSVCDVCNQTAATPFRQTHTFAHVRLILPCVLSEGAASKRFGIDEEREAVPLTLSLAYNKVLFPHTRFLQHKQ